MIPKYFVSYRLRKDAFRRKQLKTYCHERCKGESDQGVLAGTAERNVITEFEVSLSTPAASACGIRNAQGISDSDVKFNPNTPQAGCLANRVETGCSNTPQTPCSAQTPLKHPVQPNTPQTPCSAKHPSSTLFSSSTPQAP